ncbi:MAG: 2-dehydro-3-deoxygalactonokinase [Pseudomonadota bacterium]
MRPDWIAVDWGTSRLRAWAMTGSSVAAEVQSDRGMNVLEPRDFEAALLDCVHPWLGAAPVPVIACGMVGSRQGWVEAPYMRIPAEPVQAGLTRAPVRDTRIAVWVTPGLKQDEPPDVMRGEEVQIAGFLTQRPAFDGVVCLPGTHTKWARVSAGRVVGFRTFMTGEIFALLSAQSVLRHTLGKNGWDRAAFLAAVSDSIQHPEDLGAHLFGVRAGALIAGLGPERARARLSGLLVGLELAGTRDDWRGREVALVGAPDLLEIYAEALAAQGGNPAVFSGDAMTLAGLIEARTHVKEAVS